MKVNALTVSNFRNVEHAVLSPSDEMNILYGENAHGKTNLLEAIWLMTGGKSFRGSKDKDLIRFGCDKAQIHMDFEGGHRLQNAVLSIDGRRKVVVNGIEKPSPKSLTGSFCAVIFSPDHLSLIKDGPEQRRRFVDAACCQQRPAYMRILSEYNRLVKQRNGWLKLLKSGDQTAEPLYLDALNERMASLGAAVRQYRKDYIDALFPHVREFYNGLSHGREQMAIVYDVACGEEALLHDLRQSITADIKAGLSTVGPHRDDIDIAIGGCPARLYGSQGQQRSAVLALKLSEAALLADSYGEKPVILLDDVMSELDSSRQEYILNHIKGYQVFITCCDPATVTRLTDGTVFHIENGHITKTEN